MLRECNKLDLSMLKDYFIEHDEYTKEVILKEVQEHQKNNDFLCLVSSERAFDIDGFLIAYRNWDSLWIEQVWRKPGSTGSMEYLNYAKDWARKRGMTSLTGETTRNEWRALKRYGFEEYSVIVKCKI